MQKYDLKRNNTALIFAGSIKTKNWKKIGRE